MVFIQTEPDYAERDPILRTRHKFTTISLRACIPAAKMCQKANISRKFARFIHSKCLHEFKHKNTLEAVRVSGFSFYNKKLNVVFLTANWRRQYFH